MPEPFKTTTNRKARNLLLAGAVLPALVVPHSGMAFPLADSSMRATIESGGGPTVLAQVPLADPKEKAKQLQKGTPLQKGAPLQKAAPPQAQPKPVPQPAQPQAQPQQA